MGRRANKSRLALAMIASSSVCTDRSRSTGISKAFVQIHAFGSDSFEAILAEALSLDALGIVDTIEIRFAKSRHVGLKTMQEITHLSLYIHNSCHVVEDIVLRNENRSAIYTVISSIRANKTRALIINGAMSQLCGLWLYKRRK